MFNTERDRAFSGVCLLLGQLLLSISSFFWNTSGRYPSNAGAMIIIAMLFWTIGFMGLFSLVSERNRWYACLGLLYAVYGCLGGIGFGWEGIYSDLFNISDTIGIAAHQQNALAMNIALYWPGPAFPLSLVILGTYWAIKAIGARWIGVLLALGGLAFPLSRIARIADWAHAADLLLLIPTAWIAWVSLTKKQPGPHRPEAEMPSFQ